MLKTNAWDVQIKLLSAKGLLIRNVFNAEASLLFQVLPSLSKMRGVTCFHVREGATRDENLSSHVSSTNWRMRGRSFQFVPYRWSRMFSIALTICLCLYNSRAQHLFFKYGSIDVFWTEHSSDRWWRRIFKQYATQNQILMQDWMWHVMLGFFGS